MNHLSDAYYKTLEKVNAVRSDKTYWYKDINLADLLFSEVMVEELNNKENHMSFFAKIRHFIKAKKDMFNNALKEEKVEGEILFFINSSSQWSCIYPIYIDLRKANIKVLVLTTKPKLIKYLLNLKVTAALIKGFSFNTSKLPKFTTSSHKFLSTIKFYLPQIKFLEQNITNIIIKRKPRYILVGNDITFEGRLFARIAKKFNIPSGMVQHGAIDRVNLVLGRSIVDQIFVYGAKAHSSLSFLGIAPDRIFISGWPQQHNNNTDADFTQNPFGFKDFVVAAFSGHGHSVSKQHHIALIETLKKAQKELKFNLCIKLHPKDDKDNYQGFDNNLTVILDNADLQKMNISFHNLLKKALIVFSGSSTSVLDALLVGTPVITLDLFNEYSNIGFINDGFTAHATSYDSFKQHIVDLLLARKIGDNLISDAQKHAIEEYYDRFYDKTHFPEKVISHEIKVKSGLISAKED